MAAVQNLYSSTFSFSPSTEHLLQVGNSHLKRLYFVLMKQEQHISITLCDVSNDSGNLVPRGRAHFGRHQKERGLGGRECIPGPVTKLSLYSACASGGGGELRLGDGGVCIFVPFAQPITFASIIS